MAILATKGHRMEVTKGIPSRNPQDAKKKSKDLGGIPGAHVSVVQNFVSRCFACRNCWRVGWLLSQAWWQVAATQSPPTPAMWWDIKKKGTLTPVIELDRAPSADMASYGLSSKIAIYLPCRSPTQQNGMYMAKYRHTFQVSCHKIGNGIHSLWDDNIYGPASSVFISCPHLLSYSYRYGFYISYVPFYTIKERIVWCFCPGESPRWAILCLAFPYCLCIYSGMGKVKRNDWLFYWFWFGCGPSCPEEFCEAMNALLDLTPPCQGSGSGPLSSHSCPLLGRLSRLCGPSAW